jgi:hypothetical protein
VESSTVAPSRQPVYLVSVRLATGRAVFGVASQPSCTDHRCAATGTLYVQYA